MPEISRFYGIVIRMYALDHPPPHMLHSLSTARLLGISRVTVGNYVRAKGVPGRRNGAAGSLQRTRRD